MLEALLVFTIGMNLALLILYSAEETHQKMIESSKKGGSNG